MMSEDERRELDERLYRGLKESFEKMLRMKLKLGQTVVTSDEYGNPVELTAEEAWARYKGQHPESGQ